MTPRRRAVLAALALLTLLAVAGCVPEPEPVPTVEPVETPTAEPTAEPTALGSRIPVHCETVLAETGFTDIEVEPTADYGAFLGGALAQSGFEYCRGDARLGAVDAEFQLMVTPESAAAYLERSVEWARGAGYPADFAGEASYSDCSDRADLPYCFVSVATETYSFDLTIAPHEPVGAGFTDSMVGVGQQFVEVTRAWPQPAPPWQRAADAMVMAYDCSNGVASIDAPLRAAVPWSLAEPIIDGSGDAPNSYYWIFRDVEATQCVWYGEDSYGSVSVLLLPGAAWQFEAGVPLPEGDSTTVEGALAATQSSQGDGFTRISAHIDGSFLEVSVGVPTDSGHDPDAVARDVIAALVAAY